LQGEFISDFSMHSRGRLTHDHLALEIEMLFQDCVYRPTRAARTRLSLPKPANSEVLLKKIHAIVKPRAESLYSVADHLSFELLRLRADVKADQKLLCFRAALLQILYSISDMSRYVRNFQTARAVSQLARCIQPDASVPQGKLGLIRWQDETLLDDNLASMYHFCAELAELPPAALSNDLLACKFVTYLREECDRSSSRSLPASNKKLWFSMQFVSLAWTLVDEQASVEAAKPAVENEDLWKELDDCLAAHESSINFMLEEDLLNLVGIAMYIRHRLSPSGYPSGALQQSRAMLADSLIRRLMISLCLHAQKEIEAIAGAASKRRKRKKQKEKKHMTDPSCIAGFRPPSKTEHPGTTGRPQMNRNMEPKSCGLQNQLATGDLVRDLDVFADVLEKLEEPRMLGPLHTLSHFWSKSLNIPPNCPVGPYQEVATRVGSVVSALNVLSAPAWLTMLFARVASSVSETSKTTSVMPALKEDVYFATFRPCYSRRMLSRKKIHKVRLRDLFHGSFKGTVVRAVSTFHTSSFEALIGTESAKDLSNYARAALRDELNISKDGWPTTSDQADRSNFGITERHVATISSLASMAMRKHGISRLQMVLAKHDCGRLLLQSPQVPMDEPPLCPSSIPKTIREVDIVTLDKRTQDERVRGMVVPRTPLPRAKKRRIAAAESLQNFPPDTPTGNRSPALKVGPALPRFPPQTPTTPIYLGQQSVEDLLSQNVEAMLPYPVRSIHDAVRLALYGTIGDSKKGSYPIRNLRGEFYRSV
jgi:hypothetical protein